MPTFGVRQMGAYGIVADVSPYDVENEAALTAGVNIRFGDRGITRGPVARTVAPLGDLEPGHAMTIPVAANGLDEIIVASQDFGKIVRVNGQSIEDLTPEGQEPVDSRDRITSTFLGGVAYLNRFTHAPIYKAPGSEKFETLPHWPEGYRCSRLVAYKDFLVAIGVLKDGELYPTMVKWSDLTGFGAPPGTWEASVSEEDAGALESSAGENIVNEMQHAIVDALPLRDSLLLYCTNSVWTMDFIGGNLLFSWRKLFDARGVINQNCVVQVESAHFVFDRNDIWFFDGGAPQSLCQGKVKRYIFNALDYSLAHLCFVSHDPRLNEIRFHYPSKDRLVGFANAQTGCNRCAVFNYDNKTWTFYDTPNLTGTTTSAIVTGLSWADMGDVTWEEVGGPWLASNGDEDKHVLYVGRSDQAQGLTAPRLYGFDLLTEGRLTTKPEPEALRPAYLERTGLDLDSKGKHLDTYMRLLDMWPQLVLLRPEDSHWEYGANDVAQLEPEWSEPLVFDPQVDKKIDMRIAGNYLSYRFTVGGLSDFQLSGFDVRIELGGRR